MSMSLGVDGSQSTVPRKVRASSQKTLAANQIIESIPPLPEYTPFKHQKDIRQSILCLPEGFSSSDEYIFSSFFFLEESHSTITSATNGYYRMGQMKTVGTLGGIGLRQLHEKSRL
jgi:hypothetical protein